jgi:hypothetical protein
MRMMLRFTLPVEKGNQAFDAGVIGKTVESLMSKLKPEAAYFGPSEGKRYACCSGNRASDERRRSAQGHCESERSLTSRAVIGSRIRSTQLIEKLSGRAVPRSPAARQVCIDKTEVP